MNKRLISGSVLLVVLISVLALVHDFYVNNQKTARDPRNFGSYPDSGYYKINPEIILASLNRGDTNVFEPLLEDPGLIEPLTNVSFPWKQSDFLKIANALSQFVWGESLDFREWSVYELAFEKGCNSEGFSSGEITYYKTIKTDGRKVYTTRHIEIEPYFGFVKWAGDAEYSRQILHTWNNVDLTRTKITADDALLIAEENGGKEVELKEAHVCLIFVRMPSQNNNNDSWYVHFAGDHNFETLVDPFTGEFEILK
jgi:hypothetical protein